MRHAISELIIDVLESRGIYYEYTESIFPDEELITVKKTKFSWGISLIISSNLITVINNGIIYSPLEDPNNDPYPAIAKAVEIVENYMENFYQPQHKVT